MTYSKPPIRLRSQAAEIDRIRRTKFRIRAIDAANAELRKAGYPTEHNNAERKLLVERLAILDRYAWEAP